MKKKSFYPLILLLGLLSIVACQNDPEIFLEKSQEFKNVEEEEEKDYPSLFNAIKDNIKSNFLKEVNESTLILGAIQGMFDSLEDPYSRYVSKEKFDEFKKNLNSIHAGVGITLTLDIDHQFLIVESLLEGSDAQKKGLKKYDIITNVTDETDKTTEESKEEDDLKLFFERLTSGKKNTFVNIDILREKEYGKEPKKHHFRVKREILERKLVESRVFKNHLGYLKIKKFNKSSTNKVEIALLNFKAKKVKGILLDLRDNPGGLVYFGQIIASFFIKEGLIFKTIKRQSGSPELYYTLYSEYPWITDFFIPSEIPLVILANENSASTTEILIGAIKDHRRGTIVGVKTFGKGIIQSNFPVDKKRPKLGGRIFLTIEKFLTPNDKEVHKKGIEPDIKIKFPELSTLKERLQEKRDLQYLKDKKITRKYVSDYPEYNEINVENFKQELQQKKIELNNFRICSILKAEYLKAEYLKAEKHKNQSEKLIDINLDIQLREALKELYSKINNHFWDTSWESWESKYCFSEDSP